MTSCSTRRLTWRPSSSRSSAIADSRCCAISTKIDRKIASSDTTIVRRPNGNGSKGRSPSSPVFQAIQTPNQTACATRNGVELAYWFSRSTKRSSAERCFACCALIAPNARLATVRRLRRSEVRSFSFALFVASAIVAPASEKRAP